MAKLIGHLCVLFLSTVLLIEGSLIPRQTPQDNFIRSEELSDYFKATWDVDFKNKTVTFEVVAKTLGYVGFGLSTNGGMKGADIVIGGVFDNGTTYFDDRFATGSTLPEVDDVQNWELISAKEDKTAKTTTLKFVRKFLTCDSHDLDITEDTTHLIFSTGQSDDLKKHDKRGTKAINLLDPPNPPVNTKDFQTWNVTTNSPLPEVDTSYWCTVHKMPKFEKKAHIVGFSVMLNSPEALKYTHHLVLHRCVQPAGPDVDLGKILDPWIGHPGGECYERDDGVNIGQLLDYCKTYFYVWAKGGEPLLLPEHVGFPVGEDKNQDEYFVLEIHYDNPEVDKGVVYETGVTVYHTYDLRDNDAGLLFIGHDVNPSIVVPPATKDFVIVGHCGSQCTDLAFPDEGLNVFNVLLHAHLNGRQLKLRHFRNNTELPWLAYDGNYDFNYQQNRPLRTEVKLQKGDHISFECSYDTTWMNPPKAAIGGLSTRHEMCESFLLYYPLIKTVDICGSSYVPLDNIMKKIGVTAFTEPGDDPIVTAPAELAGLSYTEVLNTKVNWTKEFVDELQKQLRYEDHWQACIGYARTEKFSKGESFLSYKTKEGEELPPTTYPKIEKAYEPPPPVCDSAESLIKSSGAGVFALVFSTLALALFGR